jgi:hypothetical protein
MSQTMQDIEAAALQMPPEERGRLASRLLQSLEPAPNDSPENIAKAWAAVCPNAKRTALLCLYPR